MVRVEPPGSLSMRFTRQECCSGLPFPPPGDLPDPGIEPASLMPPELAGSLPLEPPGRPSSPAVVHFSTLMHLTFT